MKYLKRFKHTSQKFEITEEHARKCFGDELVNLGTFQRLGNEVSLTNINSTLTVLDEPASNNLKVQKNPNVILRKKLIDHIIKSWKNCENQQFELKENLHKLENYPCDFLKTYTKTWVQLPIYIRYYNSLISALEDTNNDPLTVLKGKRNYYQREYQPYRSNSTNLISNLIQEWSKQVYWEILYGEYWECSLIFLENMMNEE